MFAADIQPPCASRARSRLPPHVSFQITAVCENRDPSGPIFPLPYFRKYWAKMYVFSHGAQKSHGNPGIFTGFHWISPMDWAYFSFSLYIPKNLRNFGHKRKKVPVYAKKGLTLLPAPVYNDRTGLLRLRRAASADKFPSAI